MTIKPMAMRDALLQRIWSAMAEDRQIFFTCADFGSPVLDKIRADFPDRFVNVGIAEQNLINVSAGLALEATRSSPTRLRRSSPCAAMSRSG